MKFTPRRWPGAAESDPPADVRQAIDRVLALLAGVAGALYVPQVGIINPSEMSPANSIEIAIWAAVGGRATLIGPIIGAFIVMLPSLVAQPLSEAVMYLFGIDMNINSLPVAAIGIGIGIDYGYYVLSRIVEELPMGDNDFGYAIRRTFETTGKTVLVTGATSQIGLCVIRRLIASGAAVLAALLKRERLAEKVGWKKTLFLDAARMTVASGEAPRQVPTAVNWRFTNQGVTTGMVGGGVTINAFETVRDTSLSRDDTGTENGHRSVGKHRDAGSASGTACPIAPDDWGRGQPP